MKIIIEYWRCDLDYARELRITEEAWDLLVKAIEAGGVEVEARELPYPIEPTGSVHKVHEVLTAVHEVQGLKLVEGESVLPAIESLIAKYAALK